MPKDETTGRDEELAWDDRQGAQDFTDPAAVWAVQERNYATSLKVWWARDFGFLALLDPFTGQVYEVERTPSTPKWLTWRAMEEKQRRRKTSDAQNRGGHESRVAPAGRAAPPVPAGPVPTVPGDGGPDEERVPVRVW